MSWFTTSTGEDVSKAGGSFESAGGGAKFEPIPDGTTAVAFIEDAKWENALNGEEIINVRWSIVSPGEYSNRKIFHKLWVEDLDTQTVARNGEQKAIEKRDRNKRMFVAIDTNAGGKIVASQKKPTDESMSEHWVNKMMQIKIGLIESKRDDGTMNRTNWIMSVSPKGGSSTAKPTKVLLDDEAPF